MEIISRISVQNKNEYLYVSFGSGFHTQNECQFPFTYAVHDFCQSTCRESCRALLSRRTGTSRPGEGMALYEWRKLKPGVRPYQLRRLIGKVLVWSGGILRHFMPPIKLQKEPWNVWPWNDEMMSKVNEDNLGELRHSIAIDRTCAGEVWENRLFYKLNSNKIKG